MWVYTRVKERNVLFNNTLDTFYLVILCRKHSGVLWIANADLTFPLLSSIHFFTVTFAYNFFLQILFTRKNHKNKCHSKTKVYGQVDMTISCYVCVHGAMGHGIDPSWWTYFSFQPVMFYPVCRMMHIKEPLLLIGKSSPCGGSGFPIHYLIGPLPYVWCHITIN